MFRPCRRLIGLVIGVVFIIPTIGFAQGEYVLKNESAIGLGVGWTTSHLADAVGVTFGFNRECVDVGLSVASTGTERSSAVYGVRLRGFIKSSKEQPVLFGSLNGIMQFSDGGSVAAIGPSLYANAWFGRRSAIQFSAGILAPFRLISKVYGTAETAISGGVSVFAPLSQRGLIVLEAGVTSTMERHGTASGFGVAFVFKERRDVWE